MLEFTAGSTSVSSSSIRTESSSTSSLEVSRSRFSISKSSSFSFGLAITGDNEVTVFGVYDKVQDSEAAAPIVAEVFGDMGPLMDSVPERGIFEGFWFSK